MFKIIKKSKLSLARVGQLTLPHGVVYTPVFMPCATLGTVRAMTFQEIRDLGFELILANTYHLYLRPGMKVVNKFRGLNQLINWFSPILTDSGGFQVFSLGAGKGEDLRKGESDLLKPQVKIKSNGVEFKSHLDGSHHFFSPEKVIELQRGFGSDILMVLDVCTEYPATLKRAKETMDLTHQWAKRSINYWKSLKLDRKKSPRPLLFGIIQGSTFKSLRREATQFITSLPFDGLAVGGVSVGEGKTKMSQVLEWVSPELPQEKPHYLMGVGEPEDLILGVKKGFDLFDCVLPTRLARHGTVWVTDDFLKFNRLNLRKSSFAFEKKVILPGCRCPSCQNGYSQAFIHHLLRSGEILGVRLTTIHNLWIIRQLMENLKSKIKKSEI